MHEQDIQSSVVIWDLVRKTTKLEIAKVLEAKTEGSATASSSAISSSSSVKAWLSLYQL